MSSALENRRSFRVSESVYLQYEVLSSDEFHRGIAHRNLVSGNSDGALSRLVDIDARLSEAMFLLNADNGPVGRCMTLLNDKMNLIVEQSDGFRSSKASLASSPPQVCDVSADGLVFSSARPLAIGDHLHLQFLLSADNRYVETFCTVMRLTDPPDDSDATLRYGIAVEFTNMPSATREMLIQHMFGRESETLRMRRLELDGME